MDARAFVRQHINDVRDGIEDWLGEGQAIDSTDDDGNTINDYICDLINQSEWDKIIEDAGVEGINKTECMALIHTELTNIIPRIVLRMRTQ